MYVCLILALVVIAAIIIITKKKKEKFNPIREVLVNENEKTLINYIVDTILEDLNKNYNKKYVRGNLESAERKVNENSVDYIVKIFLYNTSDYTNQKYVFDFVLANDNVIKINNIREGDSQNPIFIYNSASGRESQVYKTDQKDFIPSKTDTDHFSKVTSTNIKVPILERNKTILPSDELENKKNTFPCRIVHFEWNRDSLLKQNCEKTKCFGNYNGASKPWIIPTYNPTLFNDETEESHWLFDLSSDSASRPIGVS